jgi:transglutaminase/protease-like cytokinesis protein 3
MFELIEKLLALFQQNKKKIDPAKYPKRKTDYGTMNARQRNAFDCILAACENGNDTADIPAMTQAEFDSVVSHIGLHFGSDDICKNIALKRGNTAAVNLAIYEQAKAHKAELDARIDKALASMHEGTRADKLAQVCKWIANNGGYAYGTNDPLDLLNGGAMCGAYSMLFYKMATRLDIKAYICYGEADNGKQKGFHAWNMADGYFYDPTFYDGGVRNSKYLRSKTAWGRAYKLNER